jgi:ABC-type nitrate/sulfonate/bicarbonate transport system permease component
MTDALISVMRIDPHYLHGLLVGAAIGVVLGLVAGAFVVLWMLEPWCEAVERDHPTLSNLAFPPRAPDPADPVVLAFPRRP